MNHKHLYTYILLLGLGLGSACSLQEQDALPLHQLPPLQPDIQGVTLPRNLAPLRFQLPDSCGLSDIQAVFYASDQKQIVWHRSGEIAIAIDDWQKLIQGQDSILVKVQGKKAGQWVEYDAFPLYLSDKILINLLSNALKYTPAGGSVEVEISKGAESDAFPAGSFILRVTDTGEGIPKEERSRIFERFYQVRSTSAGKSGTGIGLHLTASLVKLHHGTITVDDNPQGQGTRFTVTLPLGHAHLKSSEISTDTQVVMNVSHPDATLIAPDAYVAEEKTVNDTTQTKSLVVIAEDDEEIRQYIIQELSAYCRVVACSNGKEALDCTSPPRWSSCTTAPLR